MTAFERPFDAIKNSSAGVYDIAIIDFRMPDIDGFELYRKLHDIDGNLKVLFFTAYNGYERFRESFPNLNEICYMHKPASIKQVRERIENIMMVELKKY